MMRPSTLTATILAVACAGFLCTCSRDDAPDLSGTSGEGLRVVPFLQARPSDADGTGSVTLEPAAPVPAGSRGTWTVTWTAGEKGVSPGGLVMLQISLWWGWTPPQTTRPDAPGYVSVTAPEQSDPSLRIVVDPQSRQVLVCSKKRGFLPGESIAFTYKNARADKYAEKEELFQVLVDGDGDGHCATVADSPRIEILPRRPVRVVVDVPSRAEPGQAIGVTLATLDAIGNRTPCPSAEEDALFQVAVTRDGENVGSFTIASPVEESADFLTATYTLPEGEGVYFFEATGPDGLAGKSNCLLCQEGAARLNLYFGDIHGHSRLSDGTGTPEDYYAYAREVSGLDVAALTDHDSFGTFPIQGAPWERIGAATNAANEPGAFVTFLAYEWANWTYGHRNVYFRDGVGEIFSTLDESCDTPEELWRKLEPFEAMTIAHHSGGGPIPTDWTQVPDPRERVVEICSIHGSSESYGGKASIYRPVEGAFVFDALTRGYRLGLIGSGDTHDGHPGQRSAGAVTGGIFGVFAPELTREAIWKAIKKRHVYATTGARIILFTRVADSPMGSDVQWNKETVPVAVRAVACGELEAVEVIRNGRVAFRQECTGPDTTLLIEDTEPVPGTAWYLVKVVQKDGQMAWSSPVWVTRNGDR